MDIRIIPLAIGAYLLGAIPTGYLVTKWYRGTDIRKVGTGKVGAANVPSVAMRDSHDFRRNALG